MGVETSSSPNIAGYPSQERPNKEKDAKYVLAWIRAIEAKNTYMTTLFAATKYDDMNTGDVAPIWGMYPKAYRTRKETRGVADVLIHKKVWSLVSPGTNEILTGRDMKWDMPRDHVQHFDRLRNYFTHLDTSIVVRVMNKAAIDAHLDKQMLELAGATMAVDPMLKEANAMMGIDITPPPNQPQTPGEWEIFNKVGGKTTGAIVVRKAVEAVKALNRYDTEIRPRIADAIIDDGIFVLTSRRSNLGIPIIDVIPFENCAIPRTNNNFHDLPTFGYWLWMTPSQIMAEMGEECTPEVRKRLQTLGAVNAQQRMTYPVGMPLEANATELGIKVFRGMFKDYHIIETAERKSDGIRKRREDMSDEEWNSMDPAKYEMQRQTYEVVYEGSFIPGTVDGPERMMGKTKEGDGCISWGCKLSYSQARMRGSLRGSRLPVVVSAYNMTDMTLESLGARMMAAYYNVIRASLELRALLIKIQPPGLIIEESFLDRVTSHDGTGQAKRTDLIRAYRQSGTLVVNTVDPENPDQGMRGFEIGIKVDPGFIPDFERISNLIASEMARFEKVGGFNAANNGETVDDRMAVRNMNMMAESQAKALKPMTDAMSDGEGRLAEIIYAQLQATLAAGEEIEWLAPFFGDATANMVKLTSETDPMTVGIEMKQMATVQERMLFEQFLSGAVKNAEITADEAFTVSNIEDKQEAAAMLRVLSERRAKMRQEEKMQAIEAQNQGNLQAGQAGNEAMMAKVQMEQQSMMMQLEAKHKMELERMQIQAQLDMEKIAMQIEGTLSAKMQEIQAQLEMLNQSMDSKEFIAEESDKTKLEIANKGIEKAKMDNEAMIEVSKNRVPPARDSSKKG
ncbi:MAG: hypothetical protein IPN95_31535 [Bacteroidetes bacterium]|nr:hypothetical protein [Bacteroidota bacterium]